MQTVGSKEQQWHTSKSLFTGRVSLRASILIICAVTSLIILIIVQGSDQVAKIVHLNRQQAVTSNLVLEINNFVIQYFSNAVRDLAESSQIRAVCEKRSMPNNPALVSVLNTAKAVLGASQVQIVDRQGSTVGTSSSDDGQDFVRTDFSLSPSFKQAMKGIPYQYPAVNPGTGQRGFYFSAPVLDDAGGIIGVVVIATRSTIIDSFFTVLGENRDAMLLSPDGIIFSATREQWNYKTTRPVPDDRLAAIDASKQFLGFDLKPLAFSLDSDITEFDGMRALVDIKSLKLDGWQIATLEPFPFPWTAVLLLSCIALFAGLMLITIALHANKEEHLAEQIRQEKLESSRAEAARLEILRELETIFSTSLVGIMLIRDGCIQNVNDRMCEMFEYSREDLLEKDVRLFFTGRKSFRRFVRRFVRLLEVRDLEQIEYELRKKNGRIINCTLSGKAIDSSDLSQGTVWVVQDITRRKQVEKELETAKAEAEQASIAKSEFLANMSHEIRTPMNGIIGLSNILLQANLPAAQREHLELIHKSGRRLMIIINDILDFSKIEAGRFKLEKQPFSLQETIEEVIRPLQVTARDKGLQLQAKIDRVVPDIIQGDQTKLMQVITNLLDNGLKFTRSGEVGLKVRMHDMKAGSEKSLLFEVFDKGIGILPENQDTIFESFSQADTSHTRQYGGTGLGLSISKGFVQLMGGEIWFDSEPGRGTRFYFTIPLEISSVEAQDESHEGAQPPTGTILKKRASVEKRILLAEDEYINTVLAQTLLKNAGYHVTTVNNGRKAVDAWLGGVFDCILMDIQMPVMDGYEAVERIREVEEMSEHIPIIAMTAHAQTEDRKKCIQAGMDDYIAKPIDGNILLQLLENHLSSGR